MPGLSWLSPAELQGFVLQSLRAFGLDNRSQLAARWRSYIYRTPCFIDTRVVIVSPHNFVGAASSALYHGCYILNSHGRVVIGERSHLGAYSYVNALYGSVRIGEGVAIGPHAGLFSYSNHYAPGAQITREHITGDIDIADNVLIGANTVLLPGTSIESNVIIGAGSVVTGRLAGDGVYVGAPARLVSSGWYGTL